MIEIDVLTKLVIEKFEVFEEYDLWISQLSYMLEGEIQLGFYIDFES